LRSPTYLAGRLLGWLLIGAVVVVPVLMFVYLLWLFARVMPPVAYALAGAIVVLLMVGFGGTRRG